MRALGRLGAMRVRAESRMTDTCLITAPGEGQGDWDAATGSYGDVDRVTVYEGPCRIKRPDVTGTPTSAASGPEVRDVIGLILCLPVTGSEDVGAADQIVEYLTAEFDQGLVGRRLGVLGGTQGSQQTERRVRLKESV